MGLRYRTAIGKTIVDVEFNDCLALRASNTSNKREEECIHEKMKQGDIYDFTKHGWRVFPQEHEIHLVITNGNETLSAPIAHVTIMRATHYLEKSEMRTTGAHKVEKIL